MSVKRVAILTAGGLAPCLSSAVAGLIEIGADEQHDAHREAFAQLARHRWRTPAVSEVLRVLVIERKLRAEQQDQPGHV